MANPLLDPWLLFSAICLTMAVGMSLVSIVRHR